MKRILAVLMTLCVTLVSGAGVISTSALSSYNGELGIVPFADDNIATITYSVTSSSYKANLTLYSFYSGNLYLELQKKNGSSWDYADSTSSSFSSQITPSISKSRTTGSGTYRLVITVTINGTPTTRTSESFTTATAFTFYQRQQIQEQNS